MKDLLAVVVLSAIFFSISCLSSHAPTQLILGASHWFDGTIDKEVKREGRKTVKWVPIEHTYLTVKFSEPQDWSAFNALKFWMHSEKATGTDFMLILPSENEEFEGSDYFLYRIDIDWEGWKEFVIPFKEMNRARHAIGFHHIESVFFASEGWNNIAHPDAVLRLDDFRLTTLHRKGPLVSDEELFEIMDLGLPALSSVREAVESGDLELAKKEFATHVRYRDYPLWFEDRTKKPPKPPLPMDQRKNHSRADAYVEKIFTQHYNNKPWTVQFKGEIDWAANPTRDDPEAFSRDWNTLLNRHVHFRSLSSAYWETGDEKYAEALAEQWMDWIKNNPRPINHNGNNTYDGSFAWQTLTTGIRLEHIWLSGLYRCVESPAFTDEVIITIVKSFVDQARHLMKWQARANWLTVESIGLYSTGMMFPEFKEAENWRKAGIERLHGQLEKEVYPDGMEYELAGGYNNWVVSNMTALVERAKMNGFENELPEDYTERLMKMFDYLLGAMTPAGWVPGLNDSHNTTVRPVIKRATAIYPERQDYLYAATLGEEGTHPKWTSKAFPYTGHYVMRSGWDKDSVYMLLDSGRLGLAHCHEDKLTLVLWAYGRQHILDAGNFSYDQSKWVKYIRSTFGHNTVVVDGKGQSGLPQRVERTWERPWDKAVPPENDTVWQSKDEFDFVKGIYRDGYGVDPVIDVTHTRKILFVKPEYFVIQDTLVPNDEKEHLYESLFHLDAESATQEQTTFSVRTLNEGKSNLHIVPLMDDGLGLEIVKGREDPVQGWARNTKPLRPVPTAIYCRKQKGEARFVYVLYPTRKGQDCPIENVQKTDDKGEGMSIRFVDGRVDKVSFGSQIGSDTDYTFTSEDWRL